MTVSLEIPPIVQGLVGTQVTILDTSTPLSFVCYGVILFWLLSVAVLMSLFLIDGKLAVQRSDHR
ncbi:hypothetical protein [Mycobacterium lepromatosis]|uniref:hypothetical protein n=1 Tax=Mycobacterium lepromatosis TaxID=480418 RepID=UPI0005F825C1|nr:hypothetical protein [Mycobacterium lepromatosis]UKN41641.1 hypothetical protein MLPF_0359 [Mycobacterium lepromatosis]